MPDLKQPFTGLYLLILTSLGTVSVHAAVPADPINVIAAPVVQEAVADRVEALGTLRANEVVALTVNVAEMVSAVKFEGGQRVKKGQVLVEMENRQEKALLREAQFTVDEALSQLNRFRAVAKRGDASQSLLDEKQRDYDVSRARLEAIDARLQDRIVMAPFDGVVGLRNVSRGAYLAPGDIITTVIDDSKMKLDFSVPSVYLLSIRPRVSIVATSRAFPERQFTGLIEVVDNLIDPVSRSVTVRAVLSNEDGSLKPGLLMEVELLTRERDAMIVPEEALFQQSKDHFVFVIVEAESGLTVEKRQVKIGSRWLGKVEILSGLSIGDKVVTDGTLKVKSGDAVTLSAHLFGEDER
ncbi:efflux RND transporter periplasmic adaptor subunit [Ketobacter sp. MCCC 1A13808]|uniref:efflux RND transporter periplasmic adaptor subunit n=1 Tax=Ketobacter sp. MCCC 1A13808 TaxID=2602738 RepID=UPI000F1A2528|nr:efflux RND transporter periplasmic adaptor subunit [Ketobacter sp. MCCC 1A13808]MVF13052.1 efflux RND transporter periplasmic adaptor subunit [Ketobacter sp. MCCC 1A13808]RLP53036.1 MAG: efflux RND transporter periplasmic adaptor subunit [Ketobacter sp.]